MDGRMDSPTHNPIYLQNLQELHDYLSFAAFLRHVSFESWMYHKL